MPDDHRPEASNQADDSCPCYDNSKTKGLVDKLKQICYHRKYIIKVVLANVSFWNETVQLKIGIT